MSVQYSHTDEGDGLFVVRVTPPLAQFATFVTSYLVFSWLAFLLRPIHRQYLSKRYDGNIAKKFEFRNIFISCIHSIISGMCQS
jgi:hypothetical protein